MTHQNDRSYPRLAGFLAGAAVAVALVTSTAALAQVAPNLGTAAPFAVLGANSIPVIGTVTCTDTGPGTAVNGNVGSTFNAIVNTGCTINGTVTAPVAAGVVSDFNNAFANFDAANPCTGTIPTTSTVLGPGVYCETAAATIGTGVTITLNGSATDLFIFRVGTGGLGALTLTGTQIVMGGAAQACNVYWKTAEAATMTDAAFIGTVLAGTAITMTRGSYIGRALATTNVTLNDPAPLSFAGCGTTGASITVNKDFIPNSTASVPMALVCTSGTVSVTPLSASEAVPAVFTVTGAAGGATCTATETVPAGYTANQASCASVPLGGTCTITNTFVGGGPGATDTRQIPTLSEWAMILLASLLAFAGFAAIRKRNR